jgi:predicted esterase
MHELNIHVNFKARYYKLGDASSARQIWFVLHGYGQLARYFIKKFEALAGNDICILAPEGLSRFYLEDVSSRAQSGNNRVGATWMTKEDRLTDIENYITYLNSIYRHEVYNTTAPVTILGFSQGAATASRWVQQGTVQFQRLILWAGILPPDMDLDKSMNTLRNKKIIFVYGTEDPFINDKRFEEMRHIAEQLSLSLEVISFEGKHELDDFTLLKLARGQYS